MENEHRKRVVEVETVRSKGKLYGLQPKSKEELELFEGYSNIIARDKCFNYACLITIVFFILIALCTLLHGFKVCGFNLAIEYFKVMYYTFGAKILGLSLIIFRYYFPKSKK